jgi:hypothetical protein
VIGRLKVAALEATADAPPHDAGTAAEPEVTVAGTGGVAEGAAAGAEAAW